MRERIYTIVSKASRHDRISKLYDYFITAVAIISIVPLVFKTTNPFLDQLDLITVYILFLDYILRWITHDYATQRGVLAFVLYPVSPFALLDILSIMPSLGLLPGSLRILRVLRLSKVLHYSKTFSYVGHVFHKERKTLGSVLVIAIVYIFVSALAMFSYEPDTFDSFFDAMYWATTALTTVGYGDVYPLTPVGQFISMVSSLFGIAVIALPAGIVTGGFIEEIQKAKDDSVTEAAQDAAEKAADNAPAVLFYEKEGGA